jgi:Fic family protein
MKFETSPSLKFNDDYSKEYILESTTDRTTGYSQVMEFLRESDKRYFYWTDIKYRKDLPFDNANKTWQFIKMHRNRSHEKLRFSDLQFRYNATSPIQEDLYNFDLKLVSSIYQNTITPEDQAAYLKNSIMDEAIASSQIEGAATTTDVARDMIKSGRSARNESEQMILNNYRAITEIESRTEEPLSVQLILEIHQIMTANTDAAKYSGNFRNHPVHITDHVDGEIAFTAPPYDEVPELVESLIDFINEDRTFIHPIIKASVLHFMVGYIHPFGDGNGRTARALFYWYMIKKGYNLLKHISISRAIMQSRTSYDKAFLKTEHDDNDLTYFILYSVKSLRVAFENLVKYTEKKKEERSRATSLVPQLMAQGLSKRQADLIALLNSKSKDKISIFTLSDYASNNHIVRQTASRDLAELEEKGYLNKMRNGKNYIYTLAKREN